MTEDTDKWRAVVNMVMNIQFPSIASNLFSIWPTVSF